VVRPAEEDGVLELDIPAEGSGSLTPRDMLYTQFPEPLIPVVTMKRLEILYKTGDSYTGPLELVRQRV
jgi:hypothetical protein